MEEMSQGRFDPAHLAANRAEVHSVSDGAAMLPVRLVRPGMPHSSSSESAPEQAESWMMDRRFACTVIRHILCTRIHVHIQIPEDRQITARND